MFLPSAPEIGGRGMIQNSFGPRTCPILTLTGSPSFLVINQVAKVDCRPEETAEGRDKASLIKKQVQESRQEEWDRAQASVDVQQKTVAQRLSHCSALPQGNTLRSILFLYVYFLVSGLGNF